MPLTIFAVLAVTEFITGTNWGMYVGPLSPSLFRYWLGDGRAHAFGRFRSSLQAYSEAISASIPMPLY